VLVKLAHVSDESLQSYLSFVRCIDFDGISEFQTWYPKMWDLYFELVQKDPTDHNLHAMKILSKISKFEDSFVQEFLHDQTDAILKLMFECFERSVDTCLKDVGMFKSLLLDT
jgi:hypothetical protein